MPRPPHNFIWVGGAGIIILLLLVFVVPLAIEGRYKAISSTSATIASGTTTPVVPEVVHVSTPEAVKAIYMTSCVAGTPSWRNSLMDMIEKSELNAVVIDIKDYSGSITFVDPTLQGDTSRGCKVKDLAAFIKELHNRNIYVIGRISVFQDPFYTGTHPELAVRKLSDGGVWKDYKGLSFIDVGAKPYWDYIVTISKQSYAMGFDELNYDYVRYPSDGKISDIKLTWATVQSTGASSTASSTVQAMTKADILKSFFVYLHGEMKDTGAKLSVDLFGMTTTNTDDMGIGQVLENTFAYFDYVDPMVYPSHYPAGWNGYQNPATHPYEVVKIAMTSARARELAWDVANGVATSTPSKLRPWLQDFDLGAPYGVAEVQAQIKATYDSGLTSWLSWDAGNKYTPAAY